MPYRYAGKSFKQRFIKFIPTPRRNTIEIEKDIHNFKRKLRLTEYFTN